jgi:hypothetical protein
MWPGVAGLRLRQEKGGDEEGMLGQLDDARLAVAVDTAYHHSGVLQSRSIVGVDAVVAVEGFLRLGDAIHFSCPRAGADMDVLQLSDQRTSQRRDCEVVATGIRLGVVGVSGPEDVAGVFHDRVLKASSGAD